MKELIKEYCLEVSGDYACFTRPELKVERVSYDVITPSAARAIFEAILWKPAIRWEVTKIEVLKPIQWASVRRNEVGAIGSIGKECIYIDDEKNRQQRNTLLLKDVFYRIYAKLVYIPISERPPKCKEEAERRNDPNENPKKYQSCFERRAAKGQCFNQPYLGTREFAASLRWIENPEKEVDKPIKETRDLGIMQYDIDFDAEGKPSMFFRAKMENGVIKVPNKKETLR
ncbi:MAG: type I-C CRISPR-associated protein Cas5c [Mediterranea sp.]|jgi:CRISPR-associated protein Cas5d|nr:type I-C CRISPR-associated protein Cas5c [Mediterranea sp.]